VVQRIYTLTNNSIMEGKEGYNEFGESEQRKPLESEDSDNFGLPNYPESERGDEDQSPAADEGYSLESPYAPAYESTPYSTGPSEYEASAPEESFQDSYEPSDYSSYGDTGESEEEIPEEQEQQEPLGFTYQERHRSPVGWILLAVVLVVAAGVGLFWWFSQDSTDEMTEIIPPVTQTQPPVVSSEPAETEPAFTTPPSGAAQLTAGTGEVLQITESTDRYYVVISSSFDSDLANDYAKKLASEGFTSKILAPRGKAMFYRLSIADYASLPEASLKAEELKSTYGEGVWVIRY
jgi:hypothetical protein